jgi:L-lactate transport
MWNQVIDPLGSLWLSAVVAVVPIAVFLLCLVVFKLSGIVAAGAALVVEILVALLVFGMPAQAVAGAGLFGLLSSIWPIAYIIVMAVWLYKSAVASGRFAVIRSSIALVSPDQRIQVLLISFAFGAFLEGAAGFGVPIAICAALLVQLGFKPVKAAMVSLVANLGAGAYGAIGIPVIVGAQIGGVEVADLSRILVFILQPLTFLVPFLLVMILDGWRGLRETWPATLVLSIVFSGSQAAVLLLLGPELAAVIPGLLGMLALAGLRSVWQPRRIFREEGAGEPPTERHTPREVVVAWSPFYVLTAFVLVWSIPAFKALFAPGGPMSWAVLTLPIPGVTGQITTAGGAVVETTWSWTPINATGTAILLGADRHDAARAVARDGEGTVAGTRAHRRHPRLGQHRQSLGRLCEHRHGARGRRTVVPALRSRDRMDRRLPHRIGGQQQHAVRAAAGDDRSAHRCRSDAARRREHRGWSSREADLAAVDRDRRRSGGAVWTRERDPAGIDLLQPRDARLHQRLDIPAVAHALEAMRMAAMHPPARRGGDASARKTWRRDRNEATTSSVSADPQRTTHFIVPGSLNREGRRLLGGTDAATTTPIGGNRLRRHLRAFARMRQPDVD